MTGEPNANVIEVDELSVDENSETFNGYEHEEVFIVQEGDV